MVRAFPPTRHSAVAAVRSADTAERARGLAILSAVYWRPVYTYLRLRWHKPHEEAADLAQEFFVQVVQRDLLARFDPSRARLRTFLRTCILPGSLVGLLTGYATIRFGRAPSTATSS